MAVQPVPRIQQSPRIANDTAIHYGYVAFQPIRNGYDQQVQPPDSPYFEVMPCRELLPFTNLTVVETDGTISGEKRWDAGKSATIRRQRTAGECIRTLELRYEDWGFTHLSRLTGLSEDDAFDVFQTIHPFAYKLKDLVDQLGDAAEARIFATEPYTVEYEGEEVEMRPLRGDLREFAEETRAQMLRSAQTALEKAELVVERSTRSLSSYYSGRAGKSNADPLDKAIFPELDKEIPTMADRKRDEESILTKLADAITGGKKEVEKAETSDEVAELKAQIADMQTLLGQLTATQSEGKPVKKPKKTD